MHQESKLKLGFVIARSWNRGSEQVMIAAPKSTYLVKYLPDHHHPTSGSSFVGTEDAAEVAYTTYCQVSIGDEAQVIFANRQDALIETGAGGWDFFPYDDYALKLPPGVGAACIGGFPFTARVKKTPVRLKKGESFTFSKDAEMPNAYLFTAFGALQTASGVSVPDFDVVAIKSASVTLIAPENCAFCIVESLAQPVVVAGDRVPVEYMLR